MVAGVDDLADVLEREAGGHGLLADAFPDDVALADVQEAFGLVQEVVQLTFEDGLEVLLHLAAGDLDQQAVRDGRARLDLVRRRDRRR